MKQSKYYLFTLVVCVFTLVVPGVMEIWFLSQIWPWRSRKNNRNLDKGVFAHLIPTWISNYIQYKVWNEIIYPSPNMSFLSIHWRACDYLSMLGDWRLMAFLMWWPPSTTLPPPRCLINSIFIEFEVMCCMLRTFYVSSWIVPSMNESSILFSR